MRYKVEALIEVDGVEETITASVDGRDVRAWEARHAESFMTNQMSYTDMTELAFLAAKRGGQYGGTVDDWMASCIGAREISDAQEVSGAVDPTRKGHGGKRRSSS